VHGAWFELTSRTLAGQSGTERWRSVRDRLVEGIAHFEDDALGRAADALRPVCDLARAAGVSLAFETGHSALELPTPNGAALLLSELAGRGLSAWLDTGHVSAQTAVGMSGFDDWFTAVGGRWSGAHLHDCVGTRDHLAPGTGAVDLAGVMTRLPANALITLEVDWYLDEAELVAGAHIVRDILREKARF
jgi:sugar phosphate isomerase/epimerase